MILGKNGVVVRLRGVLMFESGKTEIKSGMGSFLDTFTEVLQKTNYNLIIEGHTDNIPTKKEKFPSNWELSSSRAASIVRYLIDKKIDPLRLSAVGYADQYPVEPNSSEEGRARNRRVEFVFTDKELRVGIDD